MTGQATKVFTQYADTYMTRYYRQYAIFGAAQSSLLTPCMSLGSTFNVFAVCARELHLHNAHQPPTMVMPIENNLQAWILALSGVSIALSWVAVILSLIAKNIRKRFDYSDYCIVAALVLYYSFSITTLFSTRGIDRICLMTGLCEGSTSADLT